MITQSELKATLYYEPDTGVFRRYSRTGNGKLTEEPVGYVTPKGYLRVRIGDEKYFLHRLAWLYVYGKFPKETIDHINKIPSDNRIENLRDISNFENQQNKSEEAPRNSSTGIKNITHVKGKFRVQIWKNGVHQVLGTFSTIEEASKVLSDFRSI